MPRMQWSTTSIDTAPERSAQTQQEPFLLDCAYQEDDGRWSVIVIISLLDTHIGSAERDVAAGLSDAELDRVAQELLATAIGRATAQLDTIRAQWRAFSAALLTP